MSNTPIIKTELHAKVASVLEEKLQLIQDSIEKLKSSAAEDTKSSAGDKYETGREMIRQEIDKAEKMKSEYATQQEVLKSIKADEPHQAVGQGSLVQTDKMWLYVAVSLGKINLKGQDVFVISSQAPLARMIMGKVSGDQIAFNGVSYRVLAVY